MFRIKKAVMYSNQIYYLLRVLFKLVIFSLVLYIFSFLVFKLYSSNEEKTIEKFKIKNKFELIYKNLLWGDYGDGSGPGSTINYTIHVRSILRQVIEEYSIKSMLDAPCGSFHWMPLLLKNISENLNGKHFRYHGVDVVEKLIHSARIKYPNEENWKFSVCDISAGNLPNGYELIFSRDALMHLPYKEVW